jgi:DNA-binding transcriptional LysR family regulator
MIAKMQYKISSSDLETILALSRTGTLSLASERLGVDASTIFRNLQRIEKGLGHRLFDRSRSGYYPLELAQELAHFAESIEAQLEQARSLTQTAPDQVSGLVRITTTDTVLHSLLAPELKTLRGIHPLLAFDLNAGNELVNLTRRDADIAVRATRRPPQHLIGKHVGPIRVALYSAKKSSIKKFDNQIANEATWIAPDDAMPDHPSVVWRKKNFPKVTSVFKVSSVLSVAELIGQDLGIGLLPTFLANTRTDLQQITEVIDDCQTELWLLTHTESRHLRRVSTVFSHFAYHLKLK